MTAPVPFEAISKAIIAQQVRDLCEIEAEIGRLEAKAKELKAKFAAMPHDVIYAGAQMVTVTRTEATEILDPEALLTALGMTKDEAIEQGYSKSRAGSSSVKVGVIGRSNSPTQKIAEGKAVFIAEEIQ